MPYFQPILDLRTGRISGLELLARWQHPTRGLLLPDAFIGDAEADDWIDDLTYGLLTQAFTAMKSLPRSLCVSFNLSPLQLLDHELPAKIEAIAHQSDFCLRRLTAEITETALARDQACALAIARDLKSRGCKLSLDDFGTGYSSLLHLQSLPFDEIKVDRSFVSAMLDRKECRKIVSAVIGLGRSLGIRTVAEGVEEPRQAEMLRWLGCDLCQGWLYGRPIAADAVGSFLAKQELPFPMDSMPHQGDAFLETTAEQIAELRALYDGAPVGLAFVDRSLRYRNLNQKMAEMNGAPIRDHLGHRVQEVIPALFPSVLPYLQRALAGEAIHDVEITYCHVLTRESCTRLITYQPARDEAGEVIGVSVAVMDVTGHTGTRVDPRSPHLPAVDRSCPEEAILWPWAPS